MPLHRVATGGAEPPDMIRIRKARPNHETGAGLEDRPRL